MIMNLIPKEKIKKFEVKRHVWQRYETALLSQRTNFQPFQQVLEHFWTYGDYGKVKYHEKKLFSTQGPQIEDKMIAEVFVEEEDHLPKKQSFVSQF